MPTILGAMPKVMPDRCQGGDWRGNTKPGTGSGYGDTHFKAVPANTTCQGFSHRECVCECVCTYVRVHACAEWTRVSAQITKHLCSGWRPDCRLSSHQTLPACTAAANQLFKGEASLLWHHFVSCWAKKAQLIIFTLYFSKVSQIFYSLFEFES